MKLSAAQELFIQSIVVQSGITIATLKDDVIDHLCCVTEAKMAAGNSNNIIMKKLMYSTGLISAIAMSMGTCFKFLHMPGGTELINYGFAAFVLIYLPMMLVNHFRKKNTSTPDKVKIFLGFTSAVVTGFSFLLHTFHYAWSAELLLTGAAIFSFGFLPFLFLTLYKKSVA